MRLFRQLLLLNIFLLFSAFALFAQTGEDISGEITYTTDQTPLHGATVQLVQLKQTLQADDSGNYKFSNVPPGQYTILVKLEGFSDAVKTVTVKPGESQNINFEMV